MGGTAGVLWGSLTTQSVRVPHCSKWLRRLSSVVSKLRPPMKSLRSCSGSFGDCGEVVTQGGEGERGWTQLPPPPPNLPHGIPLRSPSSREALSPPAPPSLDPLHSVTSGFSPKEAPSPPNPLYGASLHFASPRGGPFILSPPLPPSCAVLSPRETLPSPRPHAGACPDPRNTLGTPASIYGANQALGRPCEPPAPPVGLPVP